MNWKNSKNEITVKAKEDDIPKGITYSAMYLCAGPVGYKDGTYLLEQSSLDSFACTLKGCPVIIGHQDILDEDDMKRKAVGYVSNVWRCEVSGKWYADFIVFDEKANEKLANGDLPFVSCGYSASLIDGRTINNVEYKKEIVGGEMKHLALVKKPRYNDTEVWKNGLDDYLVGEGQLYNQKDSDMNILSGFRKVKSEIDKDVLFNTSAGDKTIEEIINEYEELVKEKDSYQQRIAELEATAASPATGTETTPAPAVGAPEETSGTPAPAAAPEGSDAELKQNINNAVQEEKPCAVVTVPNFKI